MVDRQTNSNLDDFEEYDQFDLLRILEIIFKSPRILLLTTSLSLIFSIIYAYMVKPVWQGDFQIVLEDSELIEAASSMGSSGTSRLFGLSRGPNKILTEVEILESPSVLKPVFDFVLEKKRSQGIETSSLRFKKWKSRLKVNLIEDTSVLNITYKDTNKNLISEVISRISNEYQDYSGRKREKRLDDGFKYLEDQIKIYKDKSITSSKNAQTFARDNNLTYIEEESDDGIIGYIDVERIRLQAVRKINNLELQLTQLQELEDDSEKIKYFGALIPKLAALGLPEELKDLDTKLLKLGTIYKDNDPIIKEIKSEKEFLIKNIKKQAYGVLNAELTEAKNQFEITKRPKGVLPKYRELLREVKRNQSTLIGLESNLQKLMLEKARNQDPWKLISKPTVLDKPISPVKRKIAALGLFGGLFIGSFLGLLKYKNDNLVFYSDEFQKIIKSKLLLNLPLAKKDIWESQIKALIKGLQNKTVLKKINLIYPGDSIPDDINEVIKIFNKTDEFDIKTNPDISELSLEDNILILAYSGKILSEDLTLKMQELKNSSINSLGWIFFYEKKNLFFK